MTFIVLYLFIIVPIVIYFKILIILNRFFFTIFEADAEYVTDK